MSFPSQDGNTAIILSYDELNELIKTIVKSELSKVTASPAYDPHERITISEVCQIYKLSKPSVHKQMNHGMPFEKMGIKTLFRRAVVDQLFSSKKAV